MKVLQVHNFYRYPGGEDRVCAAERELLSSYGHEVIRYELRNEDVEQLNPAVAALRTFWNNATYRDIRKILHDRRADVVHAHNTFPLVSPSLYYAAHSEHVPVVQTLHNYRLICPGSTLFRDGKLCEDCVGSPLPLSAVAHGCYRNSRPASAVSAGMLSVHRVLNLSLIHISEPTRP